MRLFEEIERDELGPKLESDSAFGYLNRSVRPEAERVRKVLEEWLSHYPNDHRSSLIGDLKSFNDANHLSAFFELFLHELLLRLGCRLVVHPTLPDTSRRPDFLIVPDNEPSFYLEAKVVMNLSSEEAGERARVARIIDTVNRLVKSDRIFLSIEIKKISRRDARTSKLKNWLQVRVDDIDYNELLRRVKHNQYPIWGWSDGDWLIEFTPIPKSPDKIGGPIKRIIGIGPTEIGWDGTKENLRTALVYKAGRYGLLDRPYVIATNVLSPTVDDEDIEDSILGDQVYTVQVSPSGPGPAKPGRKSNGVWTSKTGPRYTRNSAILVAKQLSPWRITTAPIRLFHNPWAKRQYESVLTRLPQWMLKRDQRHLVEGVSPSEIFELPQGWPE